MKKMALGLAALSLLVGSADAQRRSGSARTAPHPPTSNPMAALAATVMAFAPAAGMASNPTLASLRAKSSTVRWLPTPKADSKSSWLLGSMAGAEVGSPQSQTPRSISYGWGAPSGHPFGFEPHKALAARGFTVRVLYCSEMASEGTIWYFLTAPGKRATTLSVYAFDAPTGGSVATWNFTQYMDGSVPSFEEVKGDDPMATTDCPSFAAEGVRQISHADAVRISAASMAEAAGSTKSASQPTTPRNGRRSNDPASSLVLSPLMVAANSALPEAYRTGVFRFSTPSKKICSALYDSAAPAIASARSAGSWIKVANDTLGAGCGADVAYYLLGEAAERIGYRAAALSYYQEASRIASTASFRFSEHCTLNKGGTGFQGAGQGCFGVPIEVASRDAAARMQAVAITEGPTLPPSSTASLGAVEYEGAIDAGFSTAQQQLQLQVGPQQIVGRLKSQMGVLAGNVPVTGTYSNGHCIVQLRGGEDMVGTCDRQVFTGYFVQRKTGKQLKKFWFATATRWAQGEPTEIFGSGTETAQSLSPTSRQNAPVFVVTVLGRNRLLVVRGGGCSEATQLKRGYCFNEAIAQLQQNPEMRDTTVVTIDQPWALGTWVSRKVGLAWDLYKVTREGEGFKANRELGFNTRTGVPLGCSPGLQTDSGWIIVLEGGRGRAAEAARYVCDRPLDTKSGIAPVQTTLDAVMAAR